MLVELNERELVILRKVLHVSSVFLLSLTPIDLNSNAAIQEINALYEKLEKA